jgi:alpha-beta hydrolase superfamily lysophospholipase
MIQRSEFYLKTPDTNESIFLQRWKAEGSAKLTILVTHGVAEHSDCYNMTAHSLASEGIDVYAWDLPGHGKSYGQRGYISNFEEYVERLNFTLEEVKKITQQKTPIVLFGHSLGGLITTQFALHYNGKHGCKAICLSSPGFGVAVKVPFIKDQLARILVNVAPKLTIPHELNFEDLSRDRTITSTYSKDPLRHSKYSAPLYIGMLGAMNESIERAHQLRDKFFIQAAGTDRIVDVEATQKFFSRLGSTDKELKIYPESYHEIFNDLNRKEVVDDLLSYLRQFTDESTHV